MMLGRMDAGAARRAQHHGARQASARAVAQAHSAVTGTAPVFGGVPGATDGTILWRDSGIPNVVYGPGPKWIAHQPDEYVEVDDIVRKTRVYAEAALAFLTGATGARAGEAS